MNGSQIHIALTHLPVILSLVGVVVLVVTMLRKNDTLVKTAFYLLLFAGIFAIPVYFTGEAAEEGVEHLPGVSEDVIEKHEDLAAVSFGVVSAVAVVSLIALVYYSKTQLRRLLTPLVLALGLTTVGLMAVTAHLGGQVRHTEIRSDFVAPTEKNNGEH